MENPLKLLIDVARTPAVFGALLIMMVFVGCISEGADVTPKVSPTPKNVTVEIGGDKSVTENTLVTLTADATPSLPDGSIVSYIWTEGVTVLGQETPLSKIFDVGEHEIKVEVIDNT